MSKEEVGCFQIETDRKVYSPGDTLSGFIHLKICYDYPVKSLILKINGKEETHWSDPTLKTKFRSSLDNRDSNIMKTINHHGKTIFYCHKYPIYSWMNNKIQIGKYIKFPFCFQIHNYLPASFSIIGNGFKGIIEYKLTAIIEPVNEDIPVMKTKIDFHLREPPKSMFMKSMSELQINAKKYGCFSRGNSHIKCYFTNDYYKTKDKLILYCEIDNSYCNVAIYSIIVILYREIILKSDQGGIREFKEEILRTEFEGVGPRESAICQNRLENEIILEKFNQLTQQYDSLVPSTSGRIVSSNYYFEVIPLIRGTCLTIGMTPKINIPIIIYPSNNDSIIEDDVLKSLLKEAVEEKSLQMLIFNENFSYDKASKKYPELSISQLYSSVIGNKDTIIYDIMKENKLMKS